MEDSVEPEPLKKRMRWSPSIEEELELHVLLKGYITIPTKIAYQDNLDRSQVNAKQLMVHAELLQGLHRLQANLAFAPATVKKILMGLASHKKQEWRFSPADIEAFATEVGARIRTMCRHCSQALRKDPPPKWAQNMFNIKSNEVASGSNDGDTLLLESIPLPDGAVSNDTDQTSLHDAPEYFYGWNPEHKKAWRCLAEEREIKINGKLSIQPSHLSPSALPPHTSAPPSPALSPSALPPPHPSTPSNHPPPTNTQNLHTHTQLTHLSPTFHHSIPIPS